MQTSQRPRLALQSTGHIVVLARSDHICEHSRNDLGASASAAQLCSRHFSRSASRPMAGSPKAVVPMVRLNRQVLPLQDFSRSSRLSQTQGHIGRQPKSTSSKVNSRKAKLAARRASISRPVAPRSRASVKRAASASSFEDDFVPLKASASSLKSHITSAEDLWFQDSLTPSSPSGLPAGTNAPSPGPSSSSPHAAQYPGSSYTSNLSRPSRASGPAPHQLPRAPVRRRLEPKEHAFCQLVAPGNLTEEERVVWSAEENGRDRRGGWVGPDKAKDHWQETVGGKMSAMERPVEKVEPLREMHTPRLAHNLSRVLFNPGVHWLKDPRSGTYNFDPYLRHIPDVDLFDYDSLTPYLTSSVDPELRKITRREKAKYCGSTSSMTTAMSQIYFHLSGNRQPDLTGFSEGLKGTGWTFATRMPASIRLKKLQGKSEDGRPCFAIDQDKESSGEPEDSNYVLTQLGKSLEKLLTSPPDVYEKHLRINSDKLSPEERNRPESYHYARSGGIVMRSQLDCMDPRLPRRTFDLKTRAVHAVRLDRANWVESGGYRLRKLNGAYESFERELYDMVRSAFLKYFFQARIGHMDGIFVAHHSTLAIFGFQYIPLEEMARRIFGNMEMAEQSFRLSLAMLEEILDAATALFPGQGVKMTLEAHPHLQDALQVFVEPDFDAGSLKAAQARESQKSESDADDEAFAVLSEAIDTTSTIQKELKKGPRTIAQLEVLMDRYLDGNLVRGPVDFSSLPGRSVDVRSENEILKRARDALNPVDWQVEWSINPQPHLSEATIRRNLEDVRARQQAFANLSLPNARALDDRDEELLQTLASNPDALKRFLEERSKGIGLPAAPGQSRSGPEASQAKDSHASSPTSTPSNGKNLPDAAPASIFWKEATSDQISMRALARLGARDTALQEAEDRFDIWKPESPFRVHRQAYAKPASITADDDLPTKMPTRDPSFQAPTSAMKS
ncbi:UNCHARACTERIZED [Ceraceosorus bombacis]|uniref:UNCHARACTERIZED n=1 Tax=Ceraceosorus bombacis TaxID=401625 RepID=A0A0P1BKB6_9BASI|nr:UNCHARACTERIZED [Ceraceosorus bombacis]